MSTDVGYRLVLIRHAKSDYPWGVDDHDRPLNERGRRDAPCIGTWLDAHLDWGADAPPVVRVSTARRAQATWALASRQLSQRWDAADIADEPRIYEATIGTLIDVVSEAGAHARTLILVGHNPGLLGLVATLAVPDAHRHEATVKFPTSSIAVLRAEVALAQACRGREAFEVVDFAVPRG
jgi:phosphohistidine phosphatase